LFGSKKESCLSTIRLIIRVTGRIKNALSTMSFWAAVWASGSPLRTCKVRTCKVASSLLFYPSQPPTLKQDISIRFPAVPVGSLRAAEKDDCAGTARKPKWLTGAGRSSQPKPTGRAPKPTPRAPQSPRAAPQSPRAAPQSPRAAPQSPRAAPQSPRAAPRGILPQKNSRPPQNPS